MFEINSHAYLVKEIVEPACGDHPAFLMGRKGERVKILSKDGNTTYPYSVEGPTNPGKSWKACASDLMLTKPMAFN